MKHVWKLNRNGKPDDMAWVKGYHNGYKCKKCGIEVCAHCEELKTVNTEECLGDGRNEGVNRSDDQNLSRSSIFCLEAFGLGEGLDPSTLNKP